VEDCGATCGLCGHRALSVTGGDILVNLCGNKTPDGVFQIARILSLGGSLEDEFEILFEADEEGKSSRVN
jgi:hypothetical protein